MCSILFLRCAVKVGGVSDSIYCKLLMIHTVSFPLRSAIKLSTKSQIWGTLFAQEIGWYAMRRDTHYF